MERRIAAVPGRRLRRGRRRGRLSGALLVASLAALAAASAASAGITREFDVFKECPVENPAVASCIYSTTTSGEFKIGNKTVPIDETVVLQGGLQHGTEALVPAANGETLSSTPLQVPGGIIGIEILGPLTEVTATAELAGTVDVDIANTAKREGRAVSLPLKVKLDNVLLGEGCYIEAFAPQLTTGTTSPPFPAKPISGSAGTLSLAGDDKINVFHGTSLVDNAFSVPGATGCAGLLQLLVDPGVDLIVGIPASGGHNAAVLSGSLEQSGAEVVRSQLALPEIGRCVKVSPERAGRATVYHGLYGNGGCTFEIPQREGRYEWEPGAVARHFTAAGRTATLESTGGKKVLCAESAASGEYTGLRTATFSAIVFSGCKNALTREPCQSNGAAAGEVKLGAIATELGFIEDEVTGSGPVAKLGFDLADGPTFLAGSCGSSREALTVTGSVIAPISAVDEMVPSYSLTPKMKVGVQEVEGFEEEPKDTLTATIGAGGPEPAGLSASIKVADEEKLEFKALSE